MSKNCTSWGEYEPPHSSSTAALCNGGTYEGRSYRECESKIACMAATPGYSHRSLPVLGNTPRLMGSTLLGANNFPTTLPRQTTEQQYRPQQQPLVRPPTTPTPHGVGGAHVIQPPESWPEAARTPYVVQRTVVGETTPVYLPESHESVWSRLIKNIIQGMVGALGRHILEMAMNVDFFRKKKGERKDD